ncbi:hypothetical protein Hanom_Chr16g01474601 [Helianthus anomalus]
MDPTTLHHLPIYIHTTLLPSLSLSLIPISIFLSIPNYPPPSDSTRPAMLHRERSLPVSHPTGSPDPSSVTAGIRRRLSSVSLRIHPSSISDTTSAATAWAMRRSKSVSSMGESASTSIRNWWDWGWGWILSRKPVFGPDLEFNKSSSNGSNGGSWKSVFLKVRSEIRKMVRSDKVGLPQTVRYNSGSYSRNFDDGSTRF